MTTKTMKIVIELPIDDLWRAYFTDGKLHVTGAMNVEPRTEHKELGDRMPKTGIKNGKTSPMTRKQLLRSKIWVANPDEITRFTVGKAPHSILMAATDARHPEEAISVADVFKQIGGSHETKRWALYRLTHMGIVKWA